MFRTIWDWLEIEETRDKGLIRKAYARQAKKYHPEDMPEEARQLREAYKKALSLAEGGMAKDAGSGGYHRHDGEDAGSGSYRYGYGKNGEKSATPPEKPEKSEDNSGQYHYGTRGEKRVPPERFHERGETAGFDYYRFDPDKAERLKQLEERLGGLYHGAAHGDLSLWADAVKNCLSEEDLKDTHIVGAVLSSLTQMRGMDDHIWHILGKELFRYCGKGAEWTWLKSQFAAVRRENSVSPKGNAHTKQNVVIAKQIDPETGQEIPGKPVLEGHGHFKFIIIAIVIFNFVISLILAYIYS